MFSIREALISEYKQIGQLRFDVYQPYFKPGTNIGKRKKDLFELEKDAVDATILVVVVQDQIVATGCIDLVSNPKYPEFPKNSAYVTHIAVHPDFRRKGIATALIREMCKLAAKAGYTSLVLRTADNMLAAQKTYPNLGFTRQPEMDYKYPHTNLMAYTLNFNK